MNLNTPPVLNRREFISYGMVASTFPFRASAAEKEPRFIEDFSSYGDGKIICNEYATYNPRDSGAHRAENWEQTSGTWYSKDRAGYSGKPDKVPRGQNSLKESMPYNNSAVFRVVTRRDDLLMENVSLKLKTEGLSSESRSATDGIHLMLRYQSAQDFYLVTLNRRDNKVVLKRKVPDGGSANEGSYLTLAQAEYVWPLGTWQNIETKIRKQRDGANLISLRIGGKEKAACIDSGSVSPVNAKLYAPLMKPGRLGIRGDYSEFYVRNLRSD